ncbi:MAG: PIN domain-containing protein, partial [Planctomycetota bacterium]
MTRYDHVGSTPSGSSLSAETDDPTHSSAFDASDGGATPGVRKHFVLDTNVLLHNPNAIFLFQEHEVVIPLTVIEELDNFKKNNDDTGRNARQVIRQIDRLRRSGRLFDGVPINDTGGTLRIDRADRSAPFSLDLDVADNRILAVAHSLFAEGEHTVFISMDINARVKADALGILVQDFEAQKVDADWLYAGYVEVLVPDELIDELYNERQIHLHRLEPYLTAETEDGETIPVDLLANQFLLLRSQADESHTGLARRLSTTEHVIP